jgi:hypothetical protein
MAWLDIDYAELIAAPETVLRRATDFLDLEWDARVLDVSARGSIGTGSVWQARQPMHARSLERWRECMPYITPLLAAYGDQPEPTGWFRRPASST